MSKVTRQDWLVATLYAMGGGGVAAISVEGLARGLGVTKGSFYWHFDNRDALLREALQLWERVGTEEVIAEIEALEQPRDKVRRLIAMSWDQLEHLRVEAAISAAAATDHPIAAPIYRRVHGRRLAYTESIYRQLKLSPSEAKRWARLAYSAYVGTVNLLATGDNHLQKRGELRRYVALLHEQLLPDSAS